MRSNTWNKATDGGRRVVLLGDAAYCPSPFSGMGTTAAFVGAYVLAGEISQHEGNLSGALEQYENVMRPFIEDAQKVNPTTLRVGMPQTLLGVAILRFIFRVVCFLQIPKLVTRFSSEHKAGWKVPEYPKLRASKSCNE